MSNVSRGAYFKGRTKKWLMARGWQVADLEVVRWIFKSPTERMPVKRDQFGADLLAMSRKRLIFVQVKGGDQAIGAGQFLAARREFDRYTFPPFVRLWIVAWAPRARTPRIVVHQQQPEITDGQTPTDPHAQELPQQTAIAWPALGAAPRLRDHPRAGAR